MIRFAFLWAISLSMCIEALVFEVWGSNLCCECLICSLKRGFKVHFDPVIRTQQTVCLLWWGLSPKPHLLETLKQRWTAITSLDRLPLSLFHRRCFQTAHFYVEDSNSPRVVPNESIPVIPIPGRCHLTDLRPVKRFDMT